MNRTRYVLGGFLFLILGAAQLAAKDAPSWGNAPLTFEANEGQVAREVRYLARGNGYSIFITDDEMTLGFTNPSREPARMRPAGKSRDAWFEPLDPQAGASYYFRAGTQGVRAPRFAKIRDNSVWRGIDMIYYIAGRQLEYDFIVKPEGRVSDIRLDFFGGPLSIHPDGDLIIKLTDGEVRHQRPIAYQERNGVRRPIKVGFKRLSDTRIGFDVGAYDHTLPLIIDPKLDYSTYLGGSTNATLGELAFGITVDAQGYTYITGLTGATDFPLAAPIQGVIGGITDVFVTKLSPDGNAIVFSTYIGGTGSDEGHDIKVDQDGNIYVVGYAGSSNFPILNGFQRVLGGARDAFLTKLSPDGSAILYSTFLGGSSEDRAYGLAVSPEGDAYVTGVTQSTNFPVKNATQPTRGGGLNDAFITKINRDGTLEYSTFLGGAGVDLAYDITIGPDGSAYVCGYTTSVNFPRRNDNALPTFFVGNPDDAFVARLGPDGNLALSVLLGGVGSDEAVAIALDADQNIYVTGYTASVDFPVWNALQPFMAGAADIFITRIRADGSQIDFSTFWGSSEIEGGVGIAIDPNGFVVVTGFTGSFAFPLINAFQDRLNLGTPDVARDAFLLKINTEGSAVVYSTYLGGRGQDGALAMALDPVGNVLVSGYTTSAQLPVVNALQPEIADLQDSFILKFNAQDVVGQIDTQVPSLGVSRISLGGIQRSALFGWADLLVSDGAARPAGLEIIRVRQLDKTVSEVGLPLTPPITHGLMFVESMTDSVRQAIGIVNPYDENVTLEFSFTFNVLGEDGQNTSFTTESSAITVPARAQIFVLLTDFPFNLPLGIDGALTLDSSPPLAMTGVRTVINSASHLILNRAPIHNRDIVTNDPVIIDHFVEGGDWHTQVILVNPTDDDLRGNFQFFGPGNTSSTQPIEMAMTHASGTIFPYHIPPRSAIRVATTGFEPEFTTGFISIVPEPGYVTPYAFSFLEQGDRTSATLDAQAPGDRFRLYVESSPSGVGTLARRFALGMTNSSDAEVTVLLDATDVGGVATGVSTLVTMPPRTQISRFLDEIPGLDALPESFHGLLNVTVVAGTGVTTTGVQTLLNEDGEFLITTTGPIREDASTGAVTVFPYIPTGAQYTTNVILFGPADGNGVTGALRTWDGAGTPLYLLLQ